MVFQAIRDMVPALIGLVGSRMIEPEGEAAVECVMVGRRENQPVGEATMTVLEVIVAAQGTEWTPTEGDTVTVDGAGMQVLEARRVDAGSDPAYWEVFLGGAGVS